MKNIIYFKYRIKKRRKKKKEFKFSQFERNKGKKVALNHGEIWPEIWGVPFPNNMFRRGAEVQRKFARGQRWDRVVHQPLHVATN